MGAVQPEAALSAGALNDVNDILDDLLYTGWQHSQPRVGLLEAVRRYAGEATVPGFSSPSNTRLPWKGGGKMLLIDVMYGTRELYEKACLQVHGKRWAAGVVTATDTTRATKQRLLYLQTVFSKLSASMQDEVLSSLRSWRARAALLLKEKRPDKQTPVPCPDPACVDEEGQALRMWLEAGDNIVGLKRVYCRACERSFTVDELGWLARLVGEVLP